METWDAITARRNVRDFKDRPLSREHLERVHTDPAAGALNTTADPSLLGRAVIFAAFPKAVSCPARSAAILVELMVMPSPIRRARQPYTGSCGKHDEWMTITATPAAGCRSASSRSFGCMHLLSDAGPRGRAGRNRRRARALQARPHRL